MKAKKFLQDLFNNEKNLDIRSYLDKIIKVVEEKVKLTEAQTRSLNSVIGDAARKIKVRPDHPELISATKLAERINSGWQ